MMYKIILDRAAIKRPFDDLTVRFCRHDQRYPAVHSAYAVSGERLASDWIAAMIVFDCVTSEIVVFSDGLT